MKQKVIKTALTLLVITAAAAGCVSPAAAQVRGQVSRKLPVEDSRQRSPAGVTEAAPFRLTGSSDRKISVAFTLPAFEIVENEVEEYSRIDCLRAVSTVRPGYPALPSFTARIAVPQGADVSLNFSHGEDRVLGSMNPVPTPFLAGKDDIGAPMYEYVYADSFRTGGRYPALRWSAPDPGLIRRQRVVSVTVYPFQIDPVTMSVTYFSEASIEVIIAGSPPGESGIDPRVSAFDDLYRTSVINPENSRKWLKPMKPGKPGLSVFQTGEEWVKIIIREEGLYRVTYHDLFELGLDPASIDPTGFQVYYMGGQELPADISVERPEMREVAIKVTGDSDGTFDSGDMVVFYGQSLSRWISRDEYHSHRYTDENAYWLTWGNPQAAPLRMSTTDVTPTGSGQAVSTTRKRGHFEQNTEYVSDEEEGYQSVPDDWIWEEISGTPGVQESEDFNFNMNYLAGAGTDSIRVEIYGVPKFTAHKVQLSVNGRMIYEIEFTSRFAHRTPWIPLGAGDLRNGVNTLAVTLPKDEPALDEDAIYFGWFEVNTVNRLEGSGSGYIFEGHAGEGESLYELRVPSLSNPLAFDITDPYSPRELVGFVSEGDSLFFKTADSSPPATFAVLDRSLLKLPSSIAIKGILGLKNAGMGADYVIITGNELISQAQRLAEFRRENNGFSTEVVSTEDIYEEFSGGLMDVTAIRDFLAWTFENWDPAPEWAVLFGDGHLDYKGYTTFGSSKPNIVPPYVYRDLAIEDWFVRLDPGYDPDMFYGRIPVQNEEQAKVAVDKIIKYEREPEQGAWRSRVLITSDDCFRNRDCETLPHTGQSEDVDKRITPEFKRVKVYLIDYPFDPPETGLYKPAGTQELIKQWNNGAILVNYVGHGSYNRWAHEKIFYGPTDMSLLNNGRRLPLVIAASCSIGHFDHFLFDSMVEDFMVEPGRGAIASFAATRVTYPDPNREMNNAIVDTLFREPYNAPYLGVAAVRAKIEITGGNSRRYTLFGDPATRFAFPNRPIISTAAPDTLAPLGKASYSAEVTDGGVRYTTFNGYAQVDVFAPERRKYADECDCVTTSYWDTGTRLFSGSVPVSGGTMDAAFVVPGNIPLSLPADTLYTKNSRIYVYAWDAEGDAFGVVDSIPLSQVSVETGDTVPPALVVSFMGNALAGGEVVPTGASLDVQVSDPSGINLTDAPGFQILAEGDEGGSFRTVISDAFKYDIGSYTTGSARFVVPDIPAGSHMLSFRATDNALNTARESVNISVIEEGDLHIENALLYPNPFSSSCHLTFDLTTPAMVTVKIFTTGGRLIKTLRYSGNAGFNTITWDGTDHKGDGIANGAYLIKVIAGSLSSGGHGGRDEAMLKALLVK